MKKILNISIILCLVTLFIGCTKENYPSSVVTEAYPTIQLNGSEVVVLSAGQTFVDPGASVSPGYDDKGNLLADTSTLSYSIKATEVNIGTKEGIYFIPYTYTNYNGFSETVKRKVVVVNSAYTSNYAGNWKRTTGVISKWTNLGSGVHAISDPGGANLKGDILYVIIKNDNSVIIPPQTLDESHADIIGLNSVSFTPTQVKYAFIAGNGVYGTSVRTFDKQ